MKKDPYVFIKHMLTSIDWIENDLKGLSKEDFLENVPSSPPEISPNAQMISHRVSQPLEKRSQEHIAPF